LSRSPDLNAGKSTLNRLVGENWPSLAEGAIHRHRVVGIRTEGDAQMVILDTPGLLEPRDTLHTACSTQRWRRYDADVLVHVVDATARIPESLTPPRISSACRAPDHLALNKSDLSMPRPPHAHREHPDADLRGERRGDRSLVSTITNHRPSSVFYPDDELSTQPVRCFFCAELVRETALEQLEMNPHALRAKRGVSENAKPLYIRAVLHVERDSQRIVIGANGQQIARQGLSEDERFVGQPVYLDL
jgi:GTP-binding protein Era